MIVRHVGVAADDAEEQTLRELGEVIIGKMEVEASATLPLFGPEVMVKRGRKPRASSHPKPAPVKSHVADVVEEKRVVEGIGEVLGKLYDELGFNRLIGNSRQDEVLKATVLARIAEPASKHRTANLLERDFNIKLSADRIYRMMDEVYEKRDALQDAVRSATLDLFNRKLDVCFFDVTTLYFESVQEDEALKGFGYSKDQKFHSVQVVLALATTAQGLPVGYRLFHGSTAEVKTLVSCIQTWRAKVDIGNVTFVADRGMMSEANLAELQAAGFSYIVGASLKKQNAKTKSWALSELGYQLRPLEQQCVWVKEIDLCEGRKLIASYSSQRARKDRSDRDRLVEKLEKRLGQEGKGQTRKLVSNRGYVKYTRSEGTEVAVIDHDKIARDQVWDGMFGVVTNITDTRAIELLARYKQLWTIEEAFRVNKTDLRMRPIFHWKPERIEAHIAICFVAYAVARQAQYRLRQRNIHLSIDALRTELARVQASILRDTKTGKRIRLPSALSPVAETIYAALGQCRPVSPALL